MFAKSLLMSTLDLMGFHAAHLCDVFLDADDRVGAEALAQEFGIQALTALIPITPGKVIAAIGATKLRKPENDKLGIPQFCEDFRGEHDTEFAVKDLWLYRELLEGVGLLPPRLSPAETTPVEPYRGDGDGMGMF
jgi:hypothetical protein